MYLPEEIVIDDIECYLKWSQHIKEREIERFCLVEDITETLKNAPEILDLKSGTPCWVRNHTRQKSVLIRILAEKLYICLELITVLDRIASPKKGTMVIDIWEECAA